MTWEETNSELIFYHRSSGETTKITKGNIFGYTLTQTTKNTVGWKGSWSAQLLIHPNSGEEITINFTDIKHKYDMKKLVQILKELVYY